MKHQGFWTVFGGICTGLGLMMLINYVVSLTLERPLSVLYVIVAFLVFGSGLCITTSLFVLSYVSQRDLIERYKKNYLRSVDTARRISADGYLSYDVDKNILSSYLKIEVLISRCLRIYSGLSLEEAGIQVKGMPASRLTDRYLRDYGFIIEAKNPEECSEEKYKRLTVKLVGRGEFAGYKTTDWVVEGDPELTHYLFSRIA